MAPSDDVKHPTAATVELRPDEGAATADASVVDLSAPPDSEHGSLAALLGRVASAPAVVPPIELAAGDELGGAYRIVRRLGAGGMGVVYLARDLELQRDVAVKVHRAAVGTERLYREAVAMAQLAHPNVVTIHGVGRVGGRLYIAMEYVQGDNLQVWMAAAPRDWREVLEVMRAAGAGLAAAHDAGFVHRDIKPHNILVGLDGRPRVGDFGLVRVSGDVLRGEAVADDERPADEVAELDRASVAIAETARPASGPSPAPRSSSSSPLSRDLTALGTTMGTPAYMAPEQLVGGAVDARADQFAFCVVLYEALYGQRPWPGKTVGELRAEVTTIAPREPTRAGVPSWLWPALRRGLARDPDLRYPDVRALLAALQAPARRPAPARTAAIVVGGLALAAVAAVVLVRARGGGPPTSCDAAGTPAVVAWGPSARNRIAANYVNLDAAAGPDAVNQLATALDAWSLRWQRAAVTACQATRAHSWSPAVATGSAQCLTAALADLRALVARAERGPALIADAAALPDVGACADPGRLVGDRSAPGAAIEGHWNGDFGHLVLRRVGAEIWGVYAHDAGTVRGTLVGERFVGWWCEAPSRRAPGDAGDVEMQVIVDRDGVRAIAGQWRYGASGDWDDRWDLRAEPAPVPAALAARFDTPGDFCARPAP